MKKLFARLAGGIGSVILVILVIALIAGISWGVVSFFVWLICLCFGIKFTFLIATGVWLILFLLCLVFGKSSNSD